MTLEEFLAFVRSANPIGLATESLHRDFVHAIPDESKYKDFLDKVRVDYPSSEHIAIMGSGNWKFSLNPDKNFSEYHIKSDIDIAIICRASFEKTWDELREYHRKNYYLLPYRQKEMLKRNGENIYSGFISPKWIPEKSTAKFIYTLNKNKYSNDVIGFRNVNMMYFKNKDEALDYYTRGFFLAQKEK
ncbi:MAG: hypothetical protein Q7J38_04955 [Gallionella sp.]|nr:hypothetical protein [Gallionella sp.]